MCILFNKNTKNFKKRPKKPKWKKFLINLINLLKSLIWGKIGYNRIPIKFLYLLNTLPFIHSNLRQGFSHKSLYNNQLNFLQFSIFTTNSKKHRKLLKCFKSWVGYGKVKLVKNNKDFIKYYINIDNCCKHHKILSIIYNSQLNLETKKFLSASYNFTLSKSKSKK